MSPIQSRFDPGQQVIRWIGNQVIFVVEPCNKLRIAMLAGDFLT